MTHSFCDKVLHHLHQVAPITLRSRYDRWELYCDRVLFALIVDDTLYFKVDDRTRKNVVKAGLQPLVNANSVDFEAVDYCPVPLEILDDQTQLAGWVEQALAAGKRSQRQQKRDRTSWKKHRPFAPEG